MDILIVEDDNDISNLLCKIVKDSGYHPQPVFSGTEALLQLERRSYSLILLDLMLPGKSGEELLAEVRKRSDISIIIISAKEEPTIKVDMLRSGADDYITKPFNNEEVAARIEAQLRRTAHLDTRKRELTFKDIVLNEETKIVTVSEQVINLTAREFGILELFLTYPSKLFTKEKYFRSSLERRVF